MEKHLNNKNQTIASLIRETDSLISNMRKFLSEISEGSGADSIFTELQSKLPKITMGKNSIIMASMYTEANIVQAFKSLGYEYKKPIGVKLHFFNKETSISLYLNQKSREITLIP